MADLDTTDGGFTSRKMIMAYVSIGLITFGFIATAIWPALNVSYADFCVALLAATGIYTGGNAATKLIISKHITANKEKDDSEQS